MTVYLISLIGSILTIKELTVLNVNVWIRFIEIKICLILMNYNLKELYKRDQHCFKKLVF
mgnify:CR=1 FL=1